jgi:hypothetical protein
LRAHVDVTSAPNTTTRTCFGVSDRRALGDVEDDVHNPLTATGESGAEDSELVGRATNGDRTALEELARQLENGLAQGDWQTQRDEALVADLELQLGIGGPDKNVWATDPARGLLLWPTPEVVISSSRKQAAWHHWS